MDFLVSLLSFHLPCDTTQFVVYSTDFAGCICIVGTFGCQRVNSNLPLGGFACFILVATLSWGVQNVLVRDVFGCSWVVHCLCERCVESKHKHVLN